MAATIRQWEAVVALLGRLDGSVAASQHQAEFSKLLETLRTPAPRAVWKKLLQQKVPLKLLKACAQHLTDLDGPIVAAATATTVFFGAASKAGAVRTHIEVNQTLPGSSSGGGAEGASSSTASAGTGSAVSDALLLQVQQSGLLQQLPAVLSAATQQLQRVVGAAEAGQGGVGSEDTLQGKVMALLELAVTLLGLRPEQNTGVAFVLLPAVAGLILSSLRYLTCLAAAEGAGQQQQHQGAWQPQLGSLQELFGSVGRAMQMSVVTMTYDLSAFIDRSQSSVDSSSSSSAAVPRATTEDAAAKQVLCSEECFLCLAVWTIALALPFAISQHPRYQAAGGGSSGHSGGNSDSSSGGNSSGGAGASRQAGQQPLGQGAGCLPSQLRMQLMAVLQQAGVSAAVVVGMAQAQLKRRGSSFMQLDNAIATCLGFAEAQGYVLGLPQGRQQLGRFALLHELLCSALLQLARMLASFDLPQLQCCSKCCCAALLSARQVQRLLQLQAQGSSGNSGNISSNPEQDTSGQQQQGFVYSSCFQSAQDLLQQLLQLWGSATAALTATDAPIGLRLPESSSGGSTADQASVPAGLKGADGPVVLRSLSCSINVTSAALLPLLCECYGADGSAQGGCAGGQELLTAVRLCSLLSQQTRAFIEAVQVSGSSSTVALRQSGQLLATTLQVAATDLLHAVLGSALRAEVWLQLRSATHVSYDPGSPQQCHMFDLLCSLLKLCSIDNMLQQQLGFSVAGILSVVCCVATIASDCVGRKAQYIRDVTAAAQAAGAPPALRPDPQTTAAAAAAAASATTTHASTLLQPGLAAVTASGAAAAGPPAEQVYTAAAAQRSSTCCPSPTATLPWLVLLGRCCLLWSRWLQQLSTAEVAEAGSAHEVLAGQRASQVTKSTWDVTQAAAAAADPGSLLPGQCFLRSTPASVLHCVPAACGGTVGLSATIRDTAVSASVWLAAGSNMQQLSDLGYNLQPLLAALVQLRADAAAIDTAVHNVTAQQQQTGAGRAAAEAACSAERTSLIGLCPQLQVVGQALTAFAMPLACNNPGCVIASGPSEARLVGGKSCVCAGCLTARYCSRGCLKQHWKVHKPVCKALAAVGSQAATVANTHASG